METRRKLAQLGLELPPLPQPRGVYVHGLRVGELIWTSGQLPLIAGELRYKGKLGVNLTVSEGYEAAKLCVLNCLSVVEHLAGTLDAVEQVVRLVGFVASGEGFTEQAQVLNGASELLLAVFGERGKHVRCAVGVQELPLGAPVEIELLVRVRCYNT
ncbi:MAG: RidA family protein [Candidatus Caldatribacterium sp.]|uniref:RidA family protein n=1 Tax=Candidatus Caldatribacterium sp. TaxID=2282143 RepID=UPI002998AC40|nr:RidA family protein [Candidatus Caldatribacterium sp.]MCX7730996.1 RidA family protein [Candidatus Caldatribacterium sp.]MDW8080730.1 RidA family protein [Candidatus Calescibacterium sp.]